MSDDQTTYRISVQTGTADYGGTDAEVFITLYGTNGNTNELHLDNGRDNFDRGQLDVFEVTTRDVGDLQKVWIRHDDSDDDSGWYLDYVRIHDQKRGKEWYFPCFGWLATDEDPGTIDRTLYPQ
jgi:hypothetical protein